MMKQVPPMSMPFGLYRARERRSSHKNRVMASENRIARGSIKRYVFDRLVKFSVRKNILYRFAAEVRACEGPRAGRPATASASGASSSASLLAESTPQHTRAARKARRHRIRRRLRPRSRIRTLHAATVGVTARSGLDPLANKSHHWSRRMGPTAWAVCGLLPTKHLCLRSQGIAT